MHVDMAAPVHCGERATGYGVALLVTLFGRFSNSTLLQSIAPMSVGSEDYTETNGSQKKKLRTN